MIFALLVILIAMILLAVIFGYLTLGDLTNTIVWIGILALFVLLSGFSLAIAYVSKIVVSYLGGKLILAKVKPEWADHKIWPLVIGVVIFAILAALPYVGGLVSLVVVLFGLGALWTFGREALETGKAA